MPIGREWMISLGVGAIILGIQVIAAAQGCVMCRTNAEANAAAAGTAAGNNLAILLLLLPALLLLGAMWGLAYRYRESFSITDEPETSREILSQPASDNA